MRSYDEAYAAAADRSPFSNGTEGYAWTARWCDTCVNDRGSRDGTDPAGCPLLMVALTGRTPVEWIEQPWKQIVGRPEGQTAPTLGDTYHCTEYVEDGGDGDPTPEPGPDPEVSGQMTIFEVFADQFVAEIESTQPIGAA